MFPYTWLVYFVKHWHDSSHHLLLQYSNDFKISAGTMSWWCHWEPESALYLSAGGTLVLSSHIEFPLNCKWASSFNHDISPHFITWYSLKLNGKSCDNNSHLLFLMGQGVSPAILLSGDGDHLICYLKTMFQKCVCDTEVTHQQSGRGNSLQLLKIK